MKGKKTGGRQRGTLNKATLEGRRYAQAILGRTKYRASLEKRADEGTLPPGVEVHLMNTAWGRPKEMVEVAGPHGGPVTIVNEILPPLSSSGAGAR